MTPSQIAAIAREIDAHRGWRVRGVHQDDRTRFRIALEQGPKRRDLVVDLDPDRPRIHMATASPAPRRPAPLAATMRRHLSHGRLEGARAVRGERALVVAFQRGGATIPLWFEGFGRGANLYLVDPGGRVVVTPRGDVARRRGARVGQEFLAVTPTDAPPRGEDDVGATSEAIEREAHEAEAEADAARERRELGRTLERQYRRAATAAERLGDPETLAAEASAAAREARLLQASFHLLGPGQETVEVPDHEVDAPTPPLVTIRVDPRREPGEQVAHAFRRARKRERAAEEARRRGPRARAQAEAARRALEALADPATPLETLRRLAGAAGVAAPPGPGGKRGPPSPRPWREFRSQDGWPILVGRNARGNDALTLRRARPQDLFLHVRGGEGSHVVVPTPSGKTVPRDTLLDAAELAWHFSSLRARRGCEVDYVQRRHVRKPRGTAPGLVVLARQKTLSLGADPDRRRRILTTERK